MPPFCFMATGIHIVHRIIIAIAIEVQAVDGFGIQLGSIIGRDESAPFGAVVSCITIVQAGVVIVVIAAIANGVCASQRIVGGIVGNGAVTPGVIQVLDLQNAVGVINCHHVALQIPLEVIAASSTV